MAVAHKSACLKQATGPGLAILLNARSESDLSPAMAEGEVITCPEVQAAEVGNESLMYELTRLRVRDLLLHRFVVLFHPAFALQDFARPGAIRRANNAIFFHNVNQVRRPAIANPKPTLQGGG